MSIKITKEVKTVLREISLKEPLDGAGFKTAKVLLNFEIINRSEALDLLKESDVVLLKRTVKGWGDPKRDGKGGFEDEDGNAIPFTPENFDAIMDIPWISAGCGRAYMETAYGAKLGN